MGTLGTTDDCHKVITNPRWRFSETLQQSTSHISTWKCIKMRKIMREKTINSIVVPHVCQMYIMYINSLSMSFPSYLILQILEKHTNHMFLKTIHWPNDPFSQDVPRNVKRLIFLLFLTFHNLSELFTHFHNFTQFHSFTQSFFLIWVCPFFCS